MTYDPWSDAIAEAYASLPLDDVILSTLELRHPSLVKPIRIVADLGDILTEDGGDIVFGHKLKLEADAPLDPGASVDFIACGFGFSLPDQQEGQVPSVTVSVDNVAYLITPQLDALIGVRATLDITYREYLASDPDTPQFILGGLSMTSISSNLTQMTGTASFADLVNRNFPAKVYRPVEYPGLVA